MPKSTQHESEAARRAAAAAGRRAAERAERRRTVGIRVGAAAGVAAGIAGIVALAVSTTTAPKPVAVQPEAVTTAAASGSTALPPWPNAAHPAAATRAAGIIPAADEGAAEHYHAHLDVIVNGVPVPVAADIGVDETARLMSPLHTHDASGVIHVEAPTAGTPYSLGQVFTEWDVALSGTQLGALSTDGTHTLTAYVNGTVVTGDPAAITLAAHQEIALVYGPADASLDVPSTYAFGTL